MNVLIYSEKTSPRLEYVLDVFFRDWWSISWSLTHDVQVFRSNDGPKLSYGKTFTDDVPCIPDAGLLFRKEISPIIPGSCTVDDKPAFFPVGNSQATWSFDLFSLAFYHLSRYEEYIADSTSFDKFGRFKGNASIFKEVLDQPVVDLWHYALGETLQRKYPRLKLAKIPNRSILSYDIDMVRAYTWRSVRENILGIGKQVLTGKWRFVPERIGVLTGKKRDPYDLFDELRTDHRLSEAEVQYFVLIGDYGNLDRAVAVKSASFRRLINELDEYASVGLHSSVRASSDWDVLIAEKQGLEGLLDRPVRRNRQHYLQFQVPEHYSKFAEAGILEEWSMGFADLPGFRAGTSRPFEWYDLKKEKNAHMKVVPFQIMDVTMRNYCDFSPTEAIEYIRGIKDQIRMYGGTFCCLWHNSSFHRAAGWGPWHEVHATLFD